MKGGKPGRMEASWHVRNALAFQFTRFAERSCAYTSVKCRLRAGPSPLRNAHGSSNSDRKRWFGLSISGAPRARRCHCGAARRRSDGVRGAILSSGERASVASGVQDGARGLVQPPSRCQADPRDKHKSQCCHYLSHMVSLACSSPRFGPSCPAWTHGGGDLVMCICSFFHQCCI
jgi:hypothetical protein